MLTSPELREVKVAVSGANVSVRYFVHLGDVQRLVSSPY